MRTLADLTWEEAEELALVYREDEPMDADDFIRWFYALSYEEKERYNIVIQGGNVLEIF